MTPQAFFALQLKFGSLMLETQTVMALRLLAMGGVIPARPGENARMINEKAPAMTKSFMAASEAMMLGKRPEEVMNAAMAPVSRKVRSNRKRLAG